MNWEAAGVYWDVAQWVVTALVGLYAWITSRQRATQAQIGELAAATDKRLTTHAERIVRIEEQMRHLPEDSEIKGLTDRVAEIHGDLKAVSAELKGLNNVTKIMQRQVEIMDEWLRRSASEGR